jgi:hypothetical protein
MTFDTTTLPKAAWSFLCLSPHYSPLAAAVSWLPPFLPCRLFLHDPIKLAPSHLASVGRSFGKPNKGAIRNGQCAQQAAICFHRKLDVGPSQGALWNVKCYFMFCHLVSLSQQKEIVVSVASFYCSNLPIESAPSTLRTARRAAEPMWSMLRLSPDSRVANDHSLSGTCCPFVRC